MGRADPPVLPVVGLAILAVLTAVLLTRRLRRASAPLLDPAPWSVPTFNLIMVGGTAMRMLIAAVPFLLPLLFQLGFGYDPFQAGLMVLVLFAGNLGIKPLTSPILRRWASAPCWSAMACCKRRQYWAAPAVGLKHRSRCSCRCCCCCCCW